MFFQATGDLSQLGTWLGESSACYASMKTWVWIPRAHTYIRLKQKNVEREAGRQTDRQLCMYLYFTASSRIRGLLPYS